MTTAPTQMFATPNEIGVCFAIPWCSVSHGESPSLDSSWKTIATANRNSPPISEALRAGNPTADSGRRVHRRTLVRDRHHRVCPSRAGDRARTGDIQLGRLTLYQLSYTRALKPV